MSSYFRSLEPQNNPSNAREDEGLFVHFFVGAVENAFKSEKEGRPISEDHEFISIVPVGDSKSEVIRVATDYDKKRFADHYRKFKEGRIEREQVVGTRLEDWPAMTPAVVKNLQYFNVYTVEHLASMSDTAVQSYGMGGLELRAKARAYLENAANTGTSGHYAAEVERLRRDNEELRQQIRELASRIPNENPATMPEPVLEAERRGPGRPRKDAA